MLREDFTVAKGQAIGGIRDKTVAYPYADQTTRDQYRPVRVNFGTGATLVDMRSRTVSAGSRPRKNR